VRSLCSALGLLVLVSVAGCHRDRCVPICEKRAKEVPCARGEECKATCEKLHHSPVCLPQMKTFETCFLDQPTDHWTCDDEQLPVVKDDFCVKERAAVVRCLNSAPPPPLPTLPPK
jgi:hypothetical protein